MAFLLAGIVVGLVLLWRTGYDAGRRASGWHFDALRNGIVVDLGAQRHLFVSRMALHQGIAWEERLRRDWRRDDLVDSLNVAFAAKMRADWGVSS